MKIILVILGILYAVTPYDFLPDFIPGWGWLDDFAVLFLIWRAVLSPARTKPDPGGIFQGKWRWPGQNPFPGNGEGRRNTGQDGEPRKEDPYAVLGLGKDASKEEIRRAYRDLAIMYHPDKASHLGREARELAEAKFKKLQEAYQALLKT